MKKTILSIDIGLLLETSTMRQLSSNADVFFSTPRQSLSKQVQLSDVQYIPAVENALLTVKSKTRTNNGSYETVIQFSDVRYVDETTPYAVPFAINGQEFFIMPIKALGNDVQVFCSCLDFYWRFALHNNKDKSLIGEPPAPYVKKTNRPPVNPDKVPGACKHLMKLADQLRLERLLK